MRKIIFGDNQFFGINHMSYEKARAQAIQFQDMSTIIQTIDVAYDSGITGFMFTTHDRVREICDHFRQNSNRYSDLRLYPVMPYAHKYASAVADKGVLGGIKELTGGNVLGTMASGGLALVRRDAAALAKLLVNVEMSMFDGLRVDVVYMQNIVSDLLLGLGLAEPFAIFADHVKAKLGAEAGFITLNLPKMLDLLDEAGVQNPIVCSSINKIGYLMHPDRAAYEDALKTRTFRPVAMSVLASGAVSPKEAIEYVTKWDQIESIVFGASSRRNIEATKGLIEQTPWFQ